ncbi:MAG: hypothetical protein RR945_00365 [Erysipelotrichaceae bacterium]
MENQNIETNLNQFDYSVALQPLINAIESLKISIDPIIEAMQQFLERIKSIIDEFIKRYQESLKVIFESYSFEEITSYNYCDDSNSMANAPPVYKFNNHGDVTINNYNGCVITLDNNQRFFTVDRTMNLVSLLFSIAPYLPVIIDFLKAFF